MTTATIAEAAPAADTVTTAPAETVAAATPPATPPAPGATTEPPGATPPAPGATPPAPTVTPAPGATIAEGGAAPDPAADPAKPAAAAWPDDWRVQAAGEDAALAKTLEAFDSPGAMAKRLAELEAGKPPTLPKDATPEQLAEYRVAAGIPETPEGYEITPANGYVFGDADKPALDSFKAFAHANHWTPDQVAQGGEWYAQQQEHLAGLQAEADVGFKGESEAALRKDWGGEFKANLGAVQNFLSAYAPDGLADRLLAGRSADGRKLGDDPAMLSFLVRAAKEANPSPTVLPSGSMPSSTAVADELKGLRAQMGDYGSAYHRGPDSARLQARYRELITIQSKAA